MDLDRFAALPRDLGLEVGAMVEEADDPLGEDQEEDQETDDLMSRVEVFALE